MPDVLVEGPDLACCASCWQPINAAAPDSAHECPRDGEVRIIRWRADVATFSVRHPALRGHVVTGRVTYPADPAMLPTYVDRVYRAFEVMKVDRDHPGTTWRMEPDGDPPLDLLPAPERVCAECKVERPDYKGPGVHARTCPKCGSMLEPVPARNDS